MCKSSLEVIGLRDKYRLTSSSVKTDESELGTGAAGLELAAGIEGAAILFAGVCLVEVAAAAAAMIAAVLFDFEAKLGTDVDEDDEDSS